MALAGLALSTASWAHTPPHPSENSPFKGSNATLGGIINTGNTVSQSYNMGLNLNYNVGKYKNSVNSTFQRAASKGSLTAQKFYLKGQTQYEFSKSNFVFFSADYTNDKFDGYQYKMNQNIGLGHGFINNQNLNIDLYGGPGVQEFKYQKPSAGQKSGNQFMPQFKIGTTINWTINSNVSLAEDLSTTTSKDDTNTKSNLLLTSKLYKSLSMSLGYDVTYDSKPVKGAKKLSTVTTISMIYGFG